MFNVITNNTDKTGYIKVTIAGLNIEIECNYYINLFEYKKYLSDFREPDIVVRITREELENEQVALSDIINSSIVAQNKEIGLILYKSQLEAFLIHRKIANSVINYNTILMHGSVVEKDNVAYMFTASSGVGKSTRTKIWIDSYPDSVVVNGDKPLIKFLEKEVVACGTPWCGKEGWNANIMVPLRAIFLLERADNDCESTIEKIDFERAFSFLLQQSYRPIDYTALCKTVSLLKGLNGKVDIYRFRSKPDKEAIQLAYETAKPQ